MYRMTQCDYRNENTFQCRGSPGAPGGSPMKTTAAVARELGGKYELMDCELHAPTHGRGLAKGTVAGLCRSDVHITGGDLPGRLAIVGGHEGAGVVEAAGEGVTHVAPGDHVVGSFSPACGKCSSCAR